MLFWLVLHNLQLLGVEAAEAGFSGEKWTSSCSIRSPPNSMKFVVYQYFGDSSEEAKGGPEGSHQGSRRVPAPPPPTHYGASGTLLAPWSHSRGGPLAYITPSR